MKRAEPHQIYELVTSEWPNGLVRTGALTFDHARAERWAADGGRVELLTAAEHLPDEHVAHVVRNDSSFGILLGVERYRRRKGAAPKRLTMAEGRAAALEMQPANKEEYLRFCASIGALPPKAGDP